LLDIGEVTGETGNGVAKLTLMILAAVAEWERDRLRERIRNAKEHAAAQGF
jgi:DNA invertase Pin-like site-specific DNA recombinase